MSGGRPYHNTGSHGTKAGPMFGSHLRPITEIGAVMIKGLPPDEWPAATGDGYADYVPPR
jgi:hypothetical protein